MERSQRGDSSSGSDDSHSSNGETPSMLRSFPDRIRERANQTHAFRSRHFTRPEDFTSWKCINAECGRRRVGGEGWGAGAAGGPATMRTNVLATACAALGTAPPRQARKAPEVAGRFSYAILWAINRLLSTPLEPLTQSPTPQEQRVGGQVQGESRRAGGASVQPRDRRERETDPPHPRRAQGPLRGLSARSACALRVGGVW